jgi:hypothetical protein
LLVSLSLDTAIDYRKDNDFFILSFSCCWLFLLYNSHFLASKGRVIQISGSICDNLHTITGLVDGAAADSSYELYKS